MKTRLNTFVLPLLAVFALTATVEARPARPARPGVRRTSRTTPRFHGKRVPSTTDLIKRQPRTRRATRGRGKRGRTAPTTPAVHRASIVQTTSTSGKLAIEGFSALKWKTGGLYLAGAGNGQVDFAVEQTGGANVMLECEANPSNEDMLLLLTRPDGTVVTRALDKRGHQFVNFSIPSAPEEFEFSLLMAGGPNDVLSQAWVFYGCAMTLA
jgi:hypothetical protein